MSVLAFFSSVLLYPRDILGSSEGLTTVWVPVFVMIGFNAAFFTGAFFKRTRGHLLVLVGNVITLVAAYYLINMFLNYTADNHEPWIVQMAWFVRDNGLPVGILVGAATNSSVTSLSHIIASIPDGTVRGTNSKATEIAVLLALVLGLFAAYQYIYRFSATIFVLLTMFALLAVSAIACLPPAIELLGDNPPEQEIPPGRTVYYPTTRSFTPPAKVDPLKGLHDRLEMAGNERISFWWSFFLLMFANAGMVYLLIDSYPTNNENYLLYFAYFFLIWLVLVAYTYSRRRSDNMLLGKGIKRWKTSGLAYVDAIRIVAAFVACCGLMYFFKYPLYIPEVLGKIAAFSVVGCIIAAATIKSKAWNHALYLASLGVIMINYYLLFNDAMGNAYNVYGPMDIFFPFQYIHSWWHVASAGFCSGFLLANEFLRFTTRHNEGGDSIQRSMAITLASILVPGLAVYLGYGAIGSAIPGGRPEVWEPIDLTLAGNEGLVLGCLAGAGLALLAAILYIAKNAHLFGVKFLARRVENPRPSGWVGIGNHRTGAIIQGTRQNRRVKPGTASAILVLVVAGMVAGCGTLIWQTFTTSQRRPLVYYEPGKFALWLANATERLDPDTVVSLDPANIIDTFSIHAAANEYEAFQIVYTPLGQSMNDLTCMFTNFTNVNNGSQSIPASAFLIRHVENIIEDEFPDVLKPFTRLQVTGTRNHAFWVSVRVPYGTAAGAYSGTLYFKYNYNVEHSYVNTTVPVHFMVEVYNFTIPRMRHLRTNMGDMTDSPAYMASFRSHRINSYGVPIRCTQDYASFIAPGSIYTCYYNATDYTYTFNWTLWDVLTQQNLDAGANGFCFFGSPEQGMPRVPRMSEPGWNASYTSFLQQLQQHLIDKNWLEYAFIYFIDEFQMFIPEGFTADAYYKLLESFLQLINSSAPLIKIMTTTPPRSDGLAALRQYIDIYCPIALDYNKTEWEDQMAQGKEFWQYYCVGPQAPWPNSHLYNRLYETRVLLWQCFHYDIQGFLYWSSNAQYHGQYGFGYNGWGDGWFVHISDDGTVYDSPRWENYLDAQEDYEYLWLANRSIAWLRANSSVYSNAQLDAFQAMLDSAVSSVASDREIHAQHPAAIYQARATIAAMLEQFASNVDLLALGEAKWRPVG
ncbi:MAG: glycoside hydrolase domain-containing protein [Candidatus Sigynarchaeum springense]